MPNPSDLLGFALWPDAGALVYRQIYERIRGGILSGELRAGSRLPSARGLASQLAVARGTVETAYQILSTEGYVVGRGAAGTFVETALVTLPPPAPPTGRKRTSPMDSGAHGHAMPRFSSAWGCRRSMPFRASCGRG